MARGLESVYGDNRVGSDGLTKRERKFQQDSIAQDKKVDQMILQQIDEIKFEDHLSATEHETKPTTQRATKKTTGQQRPNAGVSTIKSRAAAAALSGARPQPAPASKLKATSSLLGSKKTRAPTNPSSMRHTAATANSKTTVGYSKGRNVSSKLQGKTSSEEPAKKTIHSPETYMQLYGPPPFGSEMWMRCKAAGCFDEDDLASVEETPLPYEEDEETQNFQLAL